MWKTAGAHSENRLVSQSYCPSVETASGETTVVIGRHLHFDVGDGDDDWCFLSFACCPE